MAKAVVFDFDGVIVDTEHFYLESQNLALKHFGYPGLTKEEIIEEFGSVGFFAKTLARRNIPEEVLNSVIEYRESELQALLSRAKPSRGALKLIKDLGEAGFPLAIASSSHLGWIRKILGEESGLLSSFDAIVTHEDVDLHKPHPEPYLLACSKLGLPPSQCAAIEDSLHGIASAKSAGCKVVALKNPYFPQDTSKADLAVDDLLELGPEDFSRL